MRRPVLVSALLASLACFARAGDPGSPPAARLAAAEYRVASAADGRLSAPNRAQNFRVTFDSDGVALAPRDRSTGPFACSLRFAAFGRGDVLAPPAVVQFVAEANRVCADHGGVTEWYVNDPRGLEQGFTFAERPAGDGMLVVRLEVQGSLLTRNARSAPDAIEFIASDGSVTLRYDRLVAFDADGRTLPASMRATPSGIHIEVDDRSARYPLTIDPLATSPAWSAESNQAGAQFGISSATAGDVNGDGFSDVIVGAAFFDGGQLDEGAAFVYLGSAGGLASSPAWMAESDLPGAYFGVSVDTAGDVNGDGFSDVIVGAQHAANGETQEGRAYVYLGSAIGLATTPAWIVESNKTFSDFGRDVGAAGDANGDGFSDVIVGAVGFSNGQGGEGAAFVFIGSAAGLATTPAWTFESNQAQARFGESVAGAGDIDGDGFSDVIVGAEWFDNGQSNEGRAFLFLGSASGLATSAAWTAESDVASAAFGHSVGGAGDVNGDGFSDVVVGAPGWDNGEIDEGRAFMYLGAAAGLGASPTWWFESNQAHASFANAISTAGDINGDGFADVIVGAEAFDNGQTDEGRLFAFYGGPSDLPFTPSWTAEINLAVSSLGSSVATAGDVNGDGFSDVIAGADALDDGQTDEGGAFVWNGKGGVLPLSALTVFKGEGGQMLATHGRSVAAAGDVNGDGFADVVAGAPFWDGGQFNEGRFVLYPGSATGTTATGAQSFESNEDNARLGTTVAGAGDVNGDGFADVIAVAPDSTNTHPKEGAAFVHYGSLAGLGPASWEVDGGVSTNGVQSAAPAGDVNGDGFADVLVLADQTSAYLGSASGLATTPVWSAAGAALVQGYGRVIGTAGDVNADGLSDVILGSLSFTNGQMNEGRALIYLGDATGIAATPAWTVEGNAANAHFGAAVAGAGDVNGDGFADVVVGSGTIAKDGRAQLFLGTANGPATSAAWTISGSNLSEFGSDVGTAGDVNGDGFSDVLVGATYFTNDQVNEGRAFLYVGSAGVPSTVAAWTGEAATALGEFGASLGGAGDVNGDGYADVIIGLPLYGSGSLLGQGAAWVYLGNEAVGRLVKPQQRRADDSAPIAPRGRTVTNSFLTKARLRSPFGRGDVQLVVEAKPFGVPFDGTGLVASPLADATGAGVDAAVTISGLTGNTGYHWRAHVKHAASTTPYLPAGPWFSTGVDAPVEMNLRTDWCGGTLGSAAPYGTGKPGTPGIPNLSTTVPPALGALSNVTITGAKPNAGPVLLFVGFSSTSIPFDGGTLRVNPTWTLTLPAVNPIGALQLPMQIASDPVQCGLHTYFQAFIIDPGAAGFYHTAQTNGLDWTLGS